MKLFDFLVKPVLLYGSEIWGSHINSGNTSIDKFTNKFYRTLLGVPKHTSNVGIHAELGRFPIKVNVHQSMIKYWFRLISLPSDRLAAHCYWSMFENSINNPWLNTVKNIIHSTGQFTIWYDQKSLASERRQILRSHEKMVIKVLKFNSLQNSSEKMSEETKLTLLYNSNNSHKLAQHLCCIDSRKKRSLLSKLRLGTLDLEIESGRKHQIPQKALYQAN